MDLDEQKRWIGSNFFDFYLKHHMVWKMWLSVAFAGVLMIFVFQFYLAPAIQDPSSYQEFQSFVYQYSLILCLFFGFFFSFFLAITDRNRYKGTNYFLEKVENGEPVSADKATRRYYSRLKEGMDPDDEIVVETELETKTMKFKELPDRRINLPSFTETFMSLFGLKNNRENE
jgi:hypothetical protein